MFRALFAQPFGARAFDAYQRNEARRVPEVYGVSADDRRKLLYENALRVYDIEATIAPNSSQFSSDTI